MDKDLNFNYFTGDLARQLDKEIIQELMEAHEEQLDDKCLIEMLQQIPEDVRSTQMEMDISQDFFTNSTIDSSSNITDGGAGSTITLSDEGINSVGMSDGNNYTWNIDTSDSGDLIIHTSDSEASLITFSAVTPQPTVRIVNTEFDKHLAYILDKSKAELADKVMEIGEGKFKVEDIEHKIEQLINLVKLDISW